MLKNFGGNDKRAIDAKLCKKLKEGCATGCATIWVALKIFLNIQIRALLS